MRTDASLKIRLLSKVTKTRSCWIWNGALIHNGYGRITFKLKQYLAHRISYLIFKGKIDNKLCVLHRCDNRKCINPSHLFLGTMKDNTRDAINKGRHFIKDWSGRKNPKSKFNPLSPNYIGA